MSSFSEFPSGTPCHVILIIDLGKRHLRAHFSQVAQYDKI